MVSLGVIHPENLFAPSYDSAIGRITVLPEMPIGPTNMTLYKVTPKDTDLVQTKEERSAYPPKNIPSEAEAPQFAEKILDQFGGVPLDAQLELVKTECDDYGKGSEKYRDAVFVSYSRAINGLPVIGGGGGPLILKIGENGKPLWIRKNWPTVVPAGKIDIIPASVAFEKLKNGEFIENRPKCFCDYTLKTVGLAYYELRLGDNQTYLEPAWIFGGSKSDGGGLLYPIDGRVPEKS